MNANELSDYISYENLLAIRISRQLCEQWAVDSVPTNALKVLEMLLKTSIASWPGRGLRITAEPTDFDEQPTTT